MTQRVSEKKCPGRLKRRPEFLAVQAGEKRRGGLFLLEVLDRHAPDTEARVGFTVTKKQGNAVERNRMRRKLREVVRQSAGFSMKPGHDYVIVARRDVLKASFEQLSMQLEARIETPAKPKQSGSSDHAGRTRSGNNARPRKK